MAKTKTKKTAKKTTKKQTKKIDINKSLSNRIEKAMSFLTNPRVREVIERRFGLKDGKAETLEAIGKSHGITRERVRQIQDSGLKVLRSDEVMALLEPIFKELDNVFAEHGNLIGENYLYSSIANTDDFHPLKGQAYLVLTLGSPYRRVVNDARFNNYWTTDVSARDRAEKVVDFLIDHFNKNEAVFAESDLFDIYSKKHPSLPNGLFNVVLDISREIERNRFQEVGLVHWPEITPQGVKDKAYLVLKKKGEPLHFTEIANLINEMGISDRTAYPQTVHNELIKHPRFVLIGRGTYGLTDWGYEPGTVGDIINNALSKSKKPMTKKEIIDFVLSQRRVKPATIVLNLQKIPNIVKLEGDRYTLKN